VLSLIAENTGMQVDSLEEAAALAEANDGEPIMSIFAGAGESLGRGVSMLLNTLNPELVVFLGPSVLMEEERPCAQAYRSAILEACRSGAFSSAFEDAKTVWRSLPDLAGPTGAASAVLQQFANRPLAWEVVPLDLAS
jgi:predicted NBD/HSP70 family sugar kinase